MVLLATTPALPQRLPTRTRSHRGSGTAAPPHKDSLPPRRQYRSTSRQRLAPTLASAPLLRLPTKTRSHLGGSTAVPPSRASLPPWRRRHCCASPQRLAPTLAAVPPPLPPAPRSHLGVGATAAPHALSAAAQLSRASLPPWRRRHRCASPQRLAPTASAPPLRLPPETRSHLGVGVTAAPPHKDSLPPWRQYRSTSLQRLAPTAAAAPLRLTPPALLHNYPEPRSHRCSGTAAPPSKDSFPRVGATAAPHAPGAAAQFCLILTRPFGYI